MILNLTGSWPFKTNLIFKLAFLARNSQNDLIGFKKKKKQRLEERLKKMNIFWVELIFPCLIFDFKKKCNFILKI